MGARNLEMEEGERKQSLVQREFALQVGPDARYFLIVLVCVLAAAPHAEGVDASLQLFVREEALRDVEGAGEFQTVGDVASLVSFSWQRFLS